MLGKVHKAGLASRTESISNASFLNHSAPRSSTAKPENKLSKRTTEVDFLELEDGTLLEMIENPCDESKSILALWKNGRVRYVEKLEHGDKLLVPVPKNAEIIRHVRLANGAESFDSLRILLADIMLVLHLTLKLSVEQPFLLACFVLSSWLVEKLPIAPYVALVGPPGCGKTTALRILNLLCRRSLLTADISSAAFYELCDRMTTTVLIDEAATVANRRELFHLLRAGTTEGLVAVRKGKSFTSYGARVVSWLELPDDPALNSRCLLIPMKHCERTDLLSPKDPQILRFAKKLQRQLLQFRFMNYKALPLPKIPGEEELQARTRDLLRALALPWGQDEEMCEGLCGVLRRQESLRQVLSVQQSAVLDSLYGVIHSYPELSGLSVSELTETINVNLRRIGELGKMSEKRVGNLLTSLHLTDRTRLNSGFVLWLTRETRQQIHTLAYTYGVNKGPTPKMSAGCDLCQKLSVAPTSRSEAKPVEGRERVESKSSRELGEHREHGKRRARGKSARGVPGASSSR